MDESRETKLLCGYVRVSTDMQVRGGRSLTDQDRRVEQHAAYKMDDLPYEVDTVSEPGKSATWTIRQLPIPGVPGRQVLSDLIDRCRTEEVYALVVDTQDRLARDAAIWFAIYRVFLEPYGVKLWIVDGDLDMDNPDDNTIAGFRALLDQLEVRKMSQRASRFRREQRAAGYPPGGKIGFGWRFETDQEMRRNGSLFRGILPVPEEAKWVKWIITQYVERGRTILDICAELNDRQVPYRDSEVLWYAGRVRDVLNHPFHFGLVKDNDSGLHHGAHYDQRLFDPDVYYAVRDIKRERATRGPRALSQRDAPLLGVIQCGMCGQRLQLHRDARGQTYYCCPRPQEGENRTCPGFSKRADAVDRLVAQAIGEMVAAPRLREMVREEASQVLGEHRERLECRQKELGKTLAELDGQLDDWAAKLTRGVVSEKAFVRINARWEKEREQAEEELTEVERKLEQGDVEDRRIERVMSALDNFEQTWQQVEAPRIRQLLLTMVETMTLEPEDDSGATLRTKCYYMPELTYHIPHLRNRLGEGDGPLAKLTITDLAFLALRKEGKSIKEIERARGLKPNGGHSQVARIRERTGIMDLDKVVELAEPLIEQYRPLLPVDRPSAKLTDRPLEPTERQLQTARLVGQEKTYREVGDELGITEWCVSGHMHKLRKRLGVERNKEAFMILATQGKLALPGQANSEIAEADPT